MIEDEDFEKLVQSEKAFNSINETALLIAHYYLTLRRRGLPDESALVLTDHFQTLLLTLHFGQSKPNA